MSRYPKNLILSWDTTKQGLYVSKFYPELFRETASRYLSAACFYLMIHHAVHEFHLRDECPVWLETDTGVFRDFYAKLREFDFHVAYARVGEKRSACRAYFTISLFAPAGFR